MKLHPQWSLVFLDDNSCVYLKNVPKNVDLIKRFEYKFLQPTTSLLYLEGYFADKRDEIVSEIKRWVKTNPTSFRAHFLLGYWYGRSGELDIAIIEYKKAIMLYPQSPQIHNNLGIAYVQKGLHQKAIKEFKKAISLDRNFILANKNLKKIQTGLNQ